MDPSQTSVNANQPEQTETITCMDFRSYNAAAEGEIEVFKDITNYESLHLLLTPNKNTVLHIYITALKSGSNSKTPNAGSEILNMCPSLLWQANAKGETPLHIAARYGHSDIVEVLTKYCARTLRRDLEDYGIELVKKMLRMTKKEKDTALHEAVRYNHLEVVKLLISEDPDFSYSANDAGETPLYIAAERGFKDVLFEILDKCKSPMHGGPLGRTALHAAVLQFDIGMVGRILENIDGISREKDNNGWIPLHLALSFKDIVELLLDKDREVAYMKDTKGRTLLHIAAQYGLVHAMNVIVERCPDCCELVDNRGWNVLHFAIKGGSMFLEKIMDIITENKSFSNLLNEKNADGDTPLHFYSKYATFLIVLDLIIKKFMSHPRGDKMAFNKQNLNAYDIAVTAKRSHKKRSIIRHEVHGLLPRRVITFEDGDEGGDKMDEDRTFLLRNAAEAHLVVAALITTVSFAACITMPGGFASSGEGSHPGSALLKKNVAFKAFIITDTISMVLSSSAVFIHLLMPFLFNKYSNEDHSENFLLLAFFLILGAMITMVLAFVTGTYAVLMHSLNLAIANCIIGLTFFGILFLVCKRFFRH
ncbi:ankyrin repeat-containing protein At5g02620-like [Corylus avellana]|uniref:ankyrin repeat-containing protein At5g02620-like n=1 Tax=Corylus avellana TaxID=13451 RepID=UPI00286AF73F|nr:ankyrin repeat-containing protein At5g02620-like [Corylus avellana]